MDEERIREFIKQVVKSQKDIEDSDDEHDDDSDINEKVTTLNVPGYQTPYAFKKKDDEDEEEERKRRLKVLQKKFGWTKAEDVTSSEAAQDFKAYFEPLMRRSSSLREVIIDSFLTSTKQLNENDPGRQTLGSEAAIRNAIEKADLHFSSVSSSQSGNTFVTFKSNDGSKSLILNVREAYLDY